MRVGPEMGTLTQRHSPSPCSKVALLTPDYLLGPKPGNTLPDDDYAKRLSEQGCVYAQECRVTENKGYP